MYNVSINKRDVKKDVKNMLSSKKIVDDYIKKIDWRVNENSNSQ